MDEFESVDAIKVEALYPDLREHVILERLSQGMLTDVFVAVEPTLDDREDIGDGDD